jgi:hypothetical protein
LLDHSIIHHLKQETLLGRKLHKHFVRKVHSRYRTCLFLNTNPFSMTRTKMYILIALVVLAVLANASGGLQDLFGISIFGVSKEHGWADGLFLLLAAILASLTLR